MIKKHCDFCDEVVLWDKQKPFYDIDVTISESVDDSKETPKRKVFCICYKCSNKSLVLWLFIQGTTIGEV